MDGLREYSMHEHSLFTRAWLYTVYVFFFFDRACASVTRIQAAARARMHVEQVHANYGKFLGNYENT